MTQTDLYLLSPEISMAGLAVLVVLLDLTLARKGLILVVALLGLAVPALFTTLLWGEVEGWWSLVDPLPGEVAGSSIPAIFGTISVGPFGLFFNYLFIGVVGLVVLASARYAERFQRAQGEYYALVLLSAVGMMLLATATELISLYIALELSTLPLVALVAFSGDSRSSEAGIKLLLLGALSSGILLYGIALTFGFTGSTHLGPIAQVIAGVVGSDEPFGASVLLAGVVLMVAGFGFKAAAVPFQMWVPDVYEGAPTPITAYLSVASKAAAFAVLLRVFYTAFGGLDVDWGLLFAGISAASMTVGNLVAISQSNIKRMLAYSTVAHAGYLLVGLAAVASRSGGETLGPGTLLFYLVGYAFTNLAAFFAVIAITEKTGSEVINSFAGVGRRAPLLALALAISLVSLTGIPPTVGFMAKLFIFSSAVKADLAWLVVLGVLNSVLSAYYYLRVVRIMYLAPAPSAEAVPAGGALGWAIAISVAGVIVLGLWPQAVLEVAQQAAKVLTS